MDLLPRCQTLPRQAAVGMAKVLGSLFLQSCPDHTPEKIKLEGIQVAAPKPAFNLMPPRAY